MTEYIIDEQAYNFLAEWAESHKTTVKFCPYWDKKSKVYLRDCDAVLCIEAKQYGYKFSILGKNNQLMVKGKISPDETCQNDFKATFSIIDEFYLSTPENTNLCTHCMQVFLTAFVQVNCFMWHGNIAETKDYIASGRNADGKKIITLRKYKDAIYAVPLNHHRSPEGVFSVRGHFRHYRKTGKVIWIDEYLKGTDK